MIMLRIGICDDEASAREALYLALDPLLLEGETVVYEFSNGRSAVNWLEKHPGEMELLFLDVEMEPISGLEAASRIRAFDRDLFLVFVTGHEEFALDGYQVQAADYLVKPASSQRLLEILLRVRRELEERDGSVLTFKSPAGLFRIPFRSIDYLYSEKRLVHVVSRGADTSFYGRLDTVMEGLPHRFVRIHNRYVVNADAVEQITGTFVLAAGQTLPVSRSMKKEALAAFAHLLLS